ncbi:MAG: methyltransferase regulatory domain-containing protein [Gammaproteobacteria bacterium]|nr:methyltransferase regulatory domain-containing protein [Gammaproteobacteria bacterium]
MSATNANSYDQMPYESVPFAQTHPDHLAALATLFGLQAPQLPGCRVLELGCAAGGNLIPLAEQIPGVELVGVDASERQITDGRGICSQLNLGNIALVAASIEAIDDSYGEFDFIICHGVYSWVPAAVQRAILRVCRERLRPNGIAYVSYNTLPGWRMRGTIRDLMRHHALKFPAPATQVAQARAMLDFLAQAAPAADAAYSTLLRRELEQLRGMPDSYIFHEHLEAENEPVYFNEFVARATDAGLRYLAESELGAMLMADLPRDVARVVKQLAPDAIEEQQLLDFIRNRAFRQSLLVRADQPASAAFQIERLTALYLSSPLREAPATAGHGSGPFQFGVNGSHTVSTTEPLTRAALQTLGDTWPENLPWHELLAIAGRRSGYDAQAIAAATETLLIDLLRCFGSGLLSLHTGPLACTANPGEYPRASALARWHAAHGHAVPTLRHTLMKLDEPHRAFLGWLDGTNSRAMLAEKGAAAFPGLGAAGSDKLLAGLTRAGLLLAPVVAEVSV